MAGSGRCLRWVAYTHAWCGHRLPRSRCNCAGHGNGGVRSRHGRVVDRAVRGSLTPAPEALPGPASRRHPRHRPRLPPRRCVRARPTRRCSSAWRWRSATRSRASCPVRSFANIRLRSLVAPALSCGPTLGNGPHAAITRRWMTWWNVAEGGQTGVVWPERPWGRWARGRTRIDCRTDLAGGRRVMAWLSHRQRLWI